ncbi:MAG TPA: hypothetical protein VGH67_16005 [Solirubrobacteraceae bacterium]
MQKLAAVRWPVGWRCAGVVLLLVALAGLAYEAGKPPAAGPVFSKQIEYVITTVTKPAVAIPLASLIVVALASLLRRLRFEWLVFKPGPICVRELAVAPGVTDLDITHLTGLFRGRLMQLRLHAPAPVPGATPAEDFLSVLDAEHLDAKNMLGSVVGVLRAAIPTHGYEVSVTLTQQVAFPPGKPRLGVTAQLTRLPNEGVPIETAWGHAWDDAIIQAADMVTAAVLPRTRLSNRPPWSGWRRYQMPGLVVHGYEKAQELTTARRYDEALAHCFHALDLDPKSVDLRLCKGFIEEKLGLYIDAVATYAAARRVADATARRLYNRKARRNRRASGRIARYRLAVLLGGTSFAHQWRKPGGTTRRATQRSLLRERLSPELQTLLEHHGLLSRDPAERDAVIVLLEEPAPAGAKDDEDSRYYELRRLLAQLAAKELGELQHSLNWHRSQPGSLTPLSVKLTAAAVRLRWHHIEQRRAELQGHRKSSVTPLLDCKAQPVVAVDRWRRSFQTWTEEYSAASLYALPLLIKPPRPRQGLSEEENRQGDEARAAEEARRIELGRLAVEHLRRAMSSTPSSHAAERRDWVLSEDPDLDGLRSCLAFKHFEAMFFPSPAPTPRRPRRASRWEISRYTHVLLADTARRWETVWHQRRDLVVSKIDPHVVLQWSKDEAGAWEMVARMARDYKHWPARCELIEEMMAWSAGYGFEPLDVALPRFVRDTEIGHGGDEDYDALCAAVKTEVTVNETRLRSLLDHLEPITGSDHPLPALPQDARNGAPRERRQMDAATSADPASHGPEYRLWMRVTAPLRPGEPPLRQFERLQDELSDRDFWHRAAPSPFLECVCDVHAAMWQRLHEWLEEPPDRASAAETHFTCAIAQAARLSETSGVRWVRAVIARRIQRLGSAEVVAGGQAIRP